MNSHTFPYINFIMYISDILDIKIFPSRATCASLFWINAVFILTI